MPQKLKKKDNKEETKALSMVLSDYDSSWSYTRTNYHDKWFNAWKLYNNERVDVGYKGISNTFVPMTFSTIETMVSALAGSRPRFDFRPTKPEQETDVKILNALLDYYWDADKWQSKVDKWIRSSLMYGTGVLYLWWDIDRPRVEIIPLRDFFVDPKATSPENARYMGRRFLTTKEELEEFEFWDEEKQEMANIYKNLDKVSEHSQESSDSDSQTDKQRKDMYKGSTLGKEAAGKQVEVIEYWTRDRVITIANRKVVIRDSENPYKEADRLIHEDDEDYTPSGLMPFVVQRNYIDESLFYGKGEIEPIAGLQENLNDITNQHQDAITFTLNPMYTLDPQYADWIDKVESLPGAVYPFEAGALQPIDLGNVPADAFNERLNIKNEIREATASDQVVKGVSQDTSATATEIGIQVAQAGQRLANKISQIENEGYYDFAELVLAMVQRYLKEPTMVKVIGTQGEVDWQVYDPQIYNGEYEPHVQLEATLTAKQEEEKTLAQETFLALREDPMINQQALYRMSLQKIFELDSEEIDQLLAAGEEQLTDLEGGLMPQDVPVEQGFITPQDFLPQGEVVDAIY